MFVEWYMQVNHTLDMHYTNPYILKISSLIFNPHTGGWPHTGFLRISSPVPSSLFCYNFLLPILSYLVLWSFCVLFLNYFTLYDSYQVYNLIRYRIHLLILLFRCHHIISFFNFASSCTSFENFSFHEIFWSCLP